MQMRTKILIYLAVWKRPLITELCFRGIDRIKQHPDFDIDALAVISEESAIPLCEKYGVKWVMYKNEPLGEKKNFGLKEAKKFEFDYLMEIGSDDLVLNELLDSYKEKIEQGKDFFGISDAAYINSETGECRRLISRSTYGAGRMISRKALELVGWNLWYDHLNRGMDNNSVSALNRKGIPYFRLSPMEFPGVIDIKSQENIWKFNYFLGVEYDKQNFMDKLSQPEVELLESMYAERA
jgi:hypothetical protein